MYVRTPDDGRALPGADLQVDAVQHHLLLAQRVGERDVAEGDAPAPIDPRRRRRVRGVLRVAVVIQHVQVLRRVLVPPLPRLRLRALRLERLAAQVLPDLEAGPAVHEREDGGCGADGVLDGGPAVAHVEGGGGDEVDVEEEGGWVGLGWVGGGCWDGVGLGWSGPFQSGV